MQCRTLLCSTSRLFGLAVLTSLLVLAPQIGHVSWVAAASPMVTFAVNTINDTHDAHLNDGVCADSNSQCSLRAAIEEASSESSARALLATTRRPTATAAASTTAEAE